MMLRKDDSDERISETDVLAEFYSAEERTTYELVHRTAGDVGSGTFTRFLDEGWGVRWQCGFKTNQFWYMSRADAEAHFNQIKAQLS